MCSASEAHTCSADLCLSRRHILVDAGHAYLLLTSPRANMLPCHERHQSLERARAQLAKAEAELADGAAAVNAARAALPEFVPGPKANDLDRC